MYKKILIVEDDEFISEIISRKFSERDFEVVVAHDVHDIHTAHRQIISNLEIKNKRPSYTT